MRMEKHISYSYENRCSNIWKLQTPTGDFAYISGMFFAVQDILSDREYQKKHTVE